MGFELHSEMGDVKHPAAVLLLHSWGLELGSLPLTTFQSSHLVAFVFPRVPGLCTAGRNRQKGVSALLSRPQILRHYILKGSTLTSEN